MKSIKHFGHSAFRFPAFSNISSICLLHCGFAIRGLFVVQSVPWVSLTERMILSAELLVNFGPHEALDISLGIASSSRLLWLIIILESTATCKTDIFVVGILLEGGQLFSWYTVSINNLNYIANKYFWQSFKKVQ